MFTLTLGVLAAGARSGAKKNTKRPGEGGPCLRKVPGALSHPALETHSPVSTPRLNAGCEPPRYTDACWDCHGGHFTFKLLSHPGRNFPEQET